MARKEAKRQSETKLVPLGDRVVLRRHDPEDRTAGGIVLPDTARDKPQRGEVVAAGHAGVSVDVVAEPPGVDYVGFRGREAQG